jgi:hypothetical protein
MNAREIIEAFGVPFVEVQELPKGPLPPELGASPSSEAETRLIDGVPVVWWFPYMAPWERAFPAVLHEVLHVVAGPESLKDEEGLMVCQAALISLLDPLERATAREDLANFLFTWTHPHRGDRVYEVTDDDTVFDSQEWQELLPEAEAQGLLVQRQGQWVPVFGGGVHPAWRDAPCVLPPRPTL